MSKIKNFEFETQNENENENAQKSVEVVDYHHLNDSDRSFNTTTTEILSSPNSPRRGSDFSTMLTFNNLEIVKDDENLPEKLQLDVAIDAKNNILVPNVSCDGTATEMKKTTFYSLCFGIALLCIACFAVEYYFLNYYVLSKYFGSGFSKLKFFCVGQTAGEDDFCFIAIGQFAYGIIAFGQISIGLISFSQVGVGFVLGIGQISGGIIFNIGQVVCSSYVYRAQIALGLWKVKKAQLGANALDAVINNKSFLIVGCREAVENS